MWRKPDWDDGNYMEWADQERLVRHDLQEINQRRIEGTMRDNFEIEETIAVLSDMDSNGYRKELNYVSWRGRKPKYDIRGWKNDRTELTKGITLSKEEMQILIGAAHEHMGVVTDGKV